MERVALAYVDNITAQKNDLGFHELRRLEAVIIHIEEVRVYLYGSSALVDSAHDVMESVNADHVLWALRPDPLIECAGTC